MKILHVLQELGRGGAERMTETLVQGARAAGHHVAVAAAPGDFSDVFDVPTFSLPLVQRRPHRLALAALALRRAARSWQPDLVHCHNPGMAMAAAMALGRGSHPPKLVTIHGVPDADYAIAARLLRWTAMPAVACGEGVAAALGDRGIDVKTIENGIAPAPSPAERVAIDHQFPAVRQRKLVFAAGRLVHAKNFALAIRAVARLPAVALLVAGEGPLRADLEREAMRCGAPERIAFAGYRADVRALMGAADCIVIPSLWEGFPLVGLEAMTAGCPIVAARARWQSHVLQHDINCLLVEPDDCVALASAIDRVMCEPGLAGRLAGNALRRGHDFTQKRAVDAYLDLYRSLARSERT